MSPSSNTPSTVMVLYIRCLFAYTSLSQISALGKEGMDRVWSMKVLVVGMRALGVEVAKCLCMSGGRAGDGLRRRGGGGGVSWGAAAASARETRGVSGARP